MLNVVALYFLCDIGETFIGASIIFIYVECSESLKCVSETASMAFNCYYEFSRETSQVLVSIVNASKID